MKHAVIALCLCLAVACSEGDDEDNDNSVSGTTAATSLEGASAAATAVSSAGCEESADHVVVISNFAYAPSFINVKVGETVAWINHEACGDFAPEQLVAPLAGCDTHHQVVTFPASPGGDSLDSGPLCSPNRGIAPPEGPVLIAIDTDNCADEGGSNVFCHTFENPGIQHYTCFTNPAHPLLLHGFIYVTE
ncbi:MAG: hypothetical protein ACREQJ_11950 [Candidatus Binatia bacterium]